MHKAVILDLGKTIVDFDMQRGYRALERVCPYSADEVSARISAGGLTERLETGLIEPPEFFRRFSESLDLQLDYEAFLPIWNSIFGEAIVPDSMLEALAARYRLVLLSNTNAIHFAALRRAYPQLRHFHDMVLSYEVRFAKPHPAIFHAAIARAGCLPGECFYTDDIPAFSESARALGIDAEPFQDLRS